MPVCAKTTTTTTQLESARNLGEFLQSLQSMDGEIEQNDVELIAAALRADSESEINVPDAYRILREAIVSTYPDLNTSSGLARARACADKAVAVLWPKFKAAARARDVRVQPTGTNNAVATSKVAAAKIRRRIVPTKNKALPSSVPTAVTAVAEPTLTPVAIPVATPVVTVATVTTVAPSINFWDTLKSELSPDVEPVPVSVPASVPVSVPAPFPESTVTTKMDHAIMESDVPESTAATAATAEFPTMPAQDFPQRRRRV